MPSFDVIQTATASIDFNRVMIDMFRGKTYIADDTQDMDETDYNKSVAMLTKYINKHHDIVSGTVSFYTWAQILDNRSSI